MPSGDLTDLSNEPSAFNHLTAEQKERLTEILDGYLRALEQGVPFEPAELLDENSDLAEPLQAYLQSLHELHSIAAGFGGAAAEPVVETTQVENNEKRLGDFVLGDEIGRGGMGVVYEARQISLGRRVALKVLPFAAVLDSRQIARFRNEAQAAAQLQHPNIVPVFAVGAERGVHFYAMQFIDGQPLDRAIGELRRRKQTPASASRSQAPAFNASTAEYTIAPIEAAETAARSVLTRKSTDRREYFQTVMRLGVQAAEALHAAHEQGIVHRDIKPSNLLLDSNGKLWVTDFGLARCQTSATLTRTGDVIGTLRYMAPEQALGRTALVDHRSDIYSLGVTLYELLALRPAFPDEDNRALLRQIEQDEPERLRQIDANIPADLETVVTKAIAKERDDRYATAQDLADDLRRVLDGQPTVAKPLGAIERLGRWALRRKRAVGAAAAVGLLLVVGLAAGTLLIAREKRTAEQGFARAEQNFVAARGAVDKLGAELAGRLAGVPGADQVRHELLEETLRYYQGFVAQAKDDPTLTDRIAQTYSKIGTLCDEMGTSQDAIEAHQHACELAGTLVQAQPRSAEYRRLLATSQNNLAMSLGRAGRNDPAREAYRQAIALQEQQLAELPANGEALKDLALSHSNLGLLESRTGDCAAATLSFGEALKLRQRWAALEPNNAAAQQSLAATYNNMSALEAAAHPERAVEMYEQALGHLSKATAADPEAPTCQSDIASTYNNLGAVQARLGRLDDAAASYERAIMIQAQLVRSAPAQKSHRSDLAVSYNNLGLAQSKLSEYERAESSFKEALSLQERLVAQDPADVGLQSSLGGIFNNRGIVLEELHRDREAAASYTLAVEHQRLAHEQARDVPQYRAFLSKHYYNLGRVLRRLGDADAAVEAALARRKLWPGEGEKLFSVAEELALVSKLLSTIKGSKFTSEQCASMAVDLLEEAVAAGYVLPSDLVSHESFAVLKSQPRFANLVHN